MKIIIFFIKKIKIKQHIYAWTDIKESRWVGRKAFVLAKWAINRNLKFRRQVKKFRVF